MKFKHFREFSEHSGNVFCNTFPEFNSCFFNNNLKFLYSKNSSNVYFVNSDMFTVFINLRDLYQLQLAMAQHLEVQNFLTKVP